MLILCAEEAQVEVIGEAHLVAAAVAEAEIAVALQDHRINAFGMFTAAPLRVPAHLVLPALPARVLPERRRNPPARNLQRRSHLAQNAVRRARNASPKRANVAKKLLHEREKPQLNDQSLPNKPDWPSQHCQTSSKSKQKQMFLIDIFIIVFSIRVYLFKSFIELKVTYEYHLQNKLLPIQFRRLRRNQ